MTCRCKVETILSSRSTGFTFDDKSSMDPMMPVMAFFTNIYRLITFLFVMLSSTTSLTDAVMYDYTVENLIIPECSHLAITEHQVNSFVADQGQLCCMCPMGTYIAHQCRIDDPNSTRCDGCEYDAGKQTYINYGPHQLDSCYRDTTSCVLHMIKVGGSPSSSSRCECPSGFHIVDRFRCEPDNQRTTINVVPTTLVRRILAETPTSFSNMEGLNDSRILDSNSNYDDISVTVSPTETLRNSTELHVPTSTIAMVIVVALIVFFVIGYCVAERLGWLPGIFSFCEPNHDRTSSSVAPPPIDEKPSLPDDELFQTTTTKMEELPQIPNNAVSFVANERAEDDACLILPRNVQLSVQERSQHGGEENLALENLEHSASPIRKRIPEEQDKGKSVIAKKISQREITLRYDAFMEWAEEIHEDDIFYVGRQLLSKIKKAFDDTYYKDTTCGRAEKARKIFLRAVEINPQLQLAELKELVKHLGYLHDIIENKIKILKTDGDVD